MSRTVADLLVECLVALGVARVWGEAPERPLAGVTHLSIDDADLACLIADADGRLGSSYGAALVPGNVLHLSSKPGGTAFPRSITTAEELVDACAEISVRELPDTVALHLDLDLSGPVRDNVTAQWQQERGVVLQLDPAFADASVAVVAGPGVVRGGHVDALQQLALTSGFGVVNTWGAKGVFRWDSPFHFGTAGLQERDFELSGVTSADIVVAAGIDPDESPLGALGPLTQEVDSWQLPALTSHWPGAPEAPSSRPDFYELMAAAVTPLYERESSPLSPARAALHLSGAATDGAVVTADAGWAGFWVARTFPTGVPGSVVVPATAQPGFAVAGALAARASGRDAIAVVGGSGFGRPGSAHSSASGTLDELSEQRFSAADRLELGVTIQIWDADGPTLTPATHAADTAESIRRAHPTTSLISPVGIDATAFASVEQVAGPVVAWGGLRPDY